MLAAPTFSKPPKTASWIISHQPPPPPSSKSNQGDPTFTTKSKHGTYSNNTGKMKKKSSKSKGKRVTKPPSKKNEKIMTKKSSQQQEEEEQMTKKDRSKMKDDANESASDSDSSSSSSTSTSSSSSSSSSSSDSSSSTSSSSSSSSSSSTSTTSSSSSNSTSRPLNQDLKKNQTKEEDDKRKKNQNLNPPVDSNEVKISSPNTKNDISTLSIPRKKKRKHDDSDNNNNNNNDQHAKKMSKPSSENTTSAVDVAATKTLSLSTPPNKAANNEPMEEDAPKDDVLVAPTSTARKRQKRKQNLEKRNMPSIYDDDDDDGSSDDDSRMIGNVKDYYDYDDDDDEKDPEQGLSVRELKMKILGRDVDSSKPSHRPRPMMARDLDRHVLSSVPATTKSVTPTNNKASLKNELTCIVCQEVFLDPISLPCGHSFCKNCAEWWWLQPHKRDRKDCPTCRRQVPCNTKDSDTPQIDINVALRACVMALYGEQVTKRIHATTVGEDGGTHPRGYEQLVPIGEDYWRRMDYNTSMFAKKESFLQVRHNVVLDDQDQQMQLGLSLYGLPEQMTDDSSTLIIRLVLLTMQEDEAEDLQEFPVFTSPADEDNHHFICTGQDRYQYSFLEVASCNAPEEKPGSSGGETTDGNNRNVFNYNWEPIGRSSMDQEGFMTELGIIEYHWQPLNKHRRLRFKHSETGAEMEVDMSNLDLQMLRDAAAKAAGDDLQPQVSTGRRTNSFVYDHRDQEMDDEDSNSKNEYDEDDGFLVREGSEEEDEDGEASEISGQFSSGGDDDDHHMSDTDDHCDICGQDGELIVCSAGEGDDEIGCCKAFHVTCIGRTKVPDGDWICTECAKKESHLSLIVSMTSSAENNPNYGYEFPETTGGDVKDGEGGKASDNESPVEESHQEDSESDDDIPRPRKKVDKKKPNKKQLDDDSDSEDDETFPPKSSKNKGGSGKSAVLFLDDDNDSEDEVSPNTNNKKESSKELKKTTAIHLDDSSCSDSDEEIMEVAPPVAKPSKNKKKTTQRRVIAEDSDSD